MENDIENYFQPIDEIENVSRQVRTPSTQVRTLKNERDCKWRGIGTGRNEKGVESCSEDYRQNAPEMV